MANRVTNVGLTIATGGDPKARVTNVGVEALHGGDPKARVTNVGVEALHAGNPAARLSTLAAVVAYRRVATAYENLGGYGPRVGVFDVSSSFAGGVLHPRVLVSGVQFDPGTDHGFELGSSAAVAGQWIAFKFRDGRPRVISAVKIQTFGAIPSPALVFKLQGSHDGVNYIDVGASFEILANSNTDPLFTGAASPEYYTENFVAFEWYRLTGVSGTTDSFGNSFYQVYFSISGSNAHYERLERGAIISTTLSGIPGSIGGDTNAKTLFNQVEFNSTLQPVVGAAVSPITIHITCDEPTRFHAAFFNTQFFIDPFDTGGASTLNNGVWTWEASEDDATWITVAAPFTWMTNSVDGGYLPNGAAGASYHPLTLPDDITYYKYWRFRGISGTFTGWGSITPQAGFWQCLQFDQQVPPLVDPDYPLIIGGTLVDDATFYANLTFVFVQFRANFTDDNGWSTANLTYDGSTTPWRASFHDQDGWSALDMQVIPVYNLSARFEDTDSDFYGSINGYFPGLWSQVVLITTGGA